MAHESHDDAAEKRREERLDSLETWLEESERSVRHLSAFLERLEEAPEEQLRTWFGSAMSLARDSSRDVVETRIIFDFDADEPGLIEETHCAAMDANAYQDRASGVMFRVPCDSFLEYDGLRERAAASVQQSLDAAENAVESAETKLEEIADE